MAFCSPAHCKLNHLHVPSVAKTLITTINGPTTRRSVRRRKDGESPAIVATASTTSDVATSGGTMPAYEEGQLDRPRWTGESPLSRLVGALIAFKPLYSVLKLGARQVLISTAEKTNIPWREMTKEILESEVYKEMESIQNPSLEYPDYYLNPFHAYDEGNLSWLAAAEAEAATMSMVRRAIPEAASLDEANEIVRGNWLRAIEQHHQEYSGNSTVNDILDIGCSVGVSTRFLAQKFPSAQITGLDLSPYFLAVAQFKEKNGNPRDKPIRWIHANGEDTGLPSGSFDIVSIPYVMHECPARAIVNLVKEAFRLLRPGGTLAITDNSPKSKKLQIPPRKSAASYRADEWDVNKWAWEGVLKVISKGEECIIRLEDKSTGELYAQAYLRKGELHPVEPVADSSRYFVLRVEENTGGRLRHAFIGIGFRERPQAYDFEAALHDHMKYLEKKKTAEEMEQQFQSSSSVDYSFKDGETLVLHLKNKAGKNLVRSRSSEKGGLELSPTKKGSPKESLLSIKPPPPPPSTLSPTTVSPSYSSLRSKQEISPHSISTENQSEIDAPDDDFGDFQTAG